MKCDRFEWPASFLVIVGIVGMTIGSNELFGWPATIVWLGAATAGLGWKTL